MRKIFIASILVISLLGVGFSAELINPDIEIHRTVGGLYSLISVIALNGHADVKPDNLRKYFADLRSDWQDNIRIEKHGNDLWVAVSVEKFTTAKTFLRSHSRELGITDSPAVDSWTAGHFAWLKAGTVNGGKFTPLTLKASYGSGKDSDVLFFSAKGNNSWWQENPPLTKKTKDALMKSLGVEQSGLHRPSGVSTSIYDAVRPSAVRKPADIHTKRDTSFGESYDVNMGDVIFNPIPHTTYNDYRN